MEPCQCKINYFTRISISSKLNCRPIHPKLPSLIKYSLICGEENVGGILIPKICCPQDAIAAPKEPEIEETTTQEPQTSTEPPTTPYVLLNDEDRYFQRSTYR